MTNKMTKLDRIDILCQYNKETMNLKHFSALDYVDEEVTTSVLAIEKKYKNDMGISFNRFALNQREGELKITISSHILGSRYPEKITVNNIEECLQTVLDRTYSNLFNVNELIQRGTSNHIHSTEDVVMKISKEGYRNINSLLVKPSQWNKDDRHQSSWGWKSKKAGTAGRLAFKMYDKEKQMKSKKPRREFMKINNIPENTFDGILRLELKLQSPDVIRKAYSLSDTRVTSIMESDTNPIVSFINSNFDMSGAQDKWFSKKKLGDMEKLALMEKYDNDWDIIEQEIRRVNGTNSSKMIKAYRDLYKAFVESPEVTSNGRRLLTTVVDLIEHTNEYDLLMAA